MDFQERNDDDARLAQAQDALGNPGTGEALIPADQNVVTLPAGRTIEDLLVEGRNLVIVMDDGSRIVVPDGAVFVPQIVVGGVAVPPFNVAQLLTGNEPEPAAGPPGSSGGNFAADEGAIQAAFDLGDLLPFTDFGFPQFPEEEIFPAVADREPDVVIETPDNPAGATDAIASVFEAGLPTRNSPAEPEGTNAPSNSETANGTIVFTTPDGLSQILINGVAITSTGQSFTSPFGTLTITSINLATGEVGFSYTLNDNAIGEDRDGFFAVTVIDSDGDVATASLSIVIVDDSPIAADDIGIVPAGSHAPIAGNVLENDVSGADDYAVDGAVSQFSHGAATAGAGSSLQGTYGVLTLNADGSYTYVRDFNTPGGVEDSFDYTIVDQDGSVSTATLVIEIGDSPSIITSVPQTGDGTIVNEGGLPLRGDEPAGTGEIADADPDNNSDQTETTGSVITFNSPDGLASVTINGVAVDPDNLPQTIIQTGSGTLVITGFTFDPVTGDGSIEYEFTLEDNTSGDDTNVDLEIAVTDLDGDVAAETLTITIVDDEPVAVDDTAGQGAENAPVTVDVFANDTPGADDVRLSDIALVADSLNGLGSVLYNGDGTFTYTPAPGEQGTVTFEYSITDGDGDVDTAKVTITLQRDSEPEISVEGDNGVDEAGLAARGAEPAGSDEASDSEIATGAIAIATGNDAVASLVINGTDVTGGGSVATAKGVLVITLDAGQYSYRYTLTDNTLSDPDSDSFTLMISDSDGDTASTTLVIAIVDDSPAAADDANAIAAGQFGPVGGNVLANDTQGADAANVTSYSGSGGSGGPGTVVAGTYGLLTIAADGTYSYTRNADTPGGVSDTFSYTITDGDGDPSTANLVIAIADAPTSLDLPTAGEDGTIVEEDGLAGPPAGSDAASNSEFTSGIFTFTAPDGPATVTIDGVAVATVGQTFTGTFGTLTIDAINPGSISYTYELTGNSDGDNTSDSFVVRVTDSDADFSEGTLDIAIVDDVPSVVASGQNAPLLVTDDTDISGGASDTGSFAGLFTTVFGADGPAASDATEYSLSINGGDGTDSGLDDTLTGENILLRLNGDTIEGYLETSGDIAFTLALDPVTGDITQTQLRAVEHDDPADPAETAALGDAQTLAANLISLTATVKDGDGDTDSASVDISGSFAFEDDGPTFGTILVSVGKDEDNLAGGNGDSAPGDGGNSPTTIFPFQIDFGADDAAIDELTVELVSVAGVNPNTGPLTLTSGGQPVLFDWNPASNTLTGYTTNIADPVVTLVFDTGAGTVAVNVLKPLDHPSTDADGANDGPETGYEDDIWLTFKITAIDGDGDTIISTLVVSVDDDMAIAVANTATQTTENQAFTIDALGNDAFGADGVDTADIAKVFVSTPATQGTVTYDPATGLFTYTPDPGAGSNGNTTDFFDYTIIDGDGDASTARVDITLQPDSEPEGGERVATVDDDGLAGNNPLSNTGDLNANLGDDISDTSEASFTGTLSFDVGNDGPASISFDPALNGADATVGQETVTYTVVGNTLTATVTGGDRDGTDLFTVEITDAATGRYVVTLLDNVIHAIGANENNASVSLNFVVADSENDTTTTILDIVFDDDAPTATDNDNTVDEGAIVTGNVLTDNDGDGTDAPGADGYGSNGAVISLASVTFGGSTSTVDGSGNLVISTALGTLTVNAVTGAYSYESNSNSTNADTSDVFTYTIIDGDGDETTATLTIDITNAPGEVSDNDVTVNEAGLAGGSDPLATSEIDADGQISVVGATGTVVFSLVGGVAGPGADEVQIDGTYGTIVLNTVTGAYTYTLDTPFTDSVIENGANTISPAESFSYEVRDTNGNLIGGSAIVVSIIDDVPTATDQANVNVAEDAAGPIGGNVMTDGTPDTQGADGASVTAITIDGNTTAVPQDGNDAVVVTAKGTYTIDMDGNWTFDPNPNLDHTGGDISADFTYTLTDGDGDFDTAVQPITITDGADPSAGPDITLALDDQNLADGSTPAGPDFDSDTIVFTQGSDNIASIVFGGVGSLGGGLTWTRVSDTQITGSDGGRLVVTLDLSVTGTTATVTATLNDNFDDHPGINIDDLADLGLVEVVATDMDGDPTSATVSVSVSDDLPSISASAPSAGELTVDETDLLTNDTADFSGLFTSDANADGPGSVGNYTLGINAGSTGLVDTATNEAVVLSLNGGVVEGYTATTNQLVFTVSVNSTTGVVTLDQLRAVKHGNTSDDNDPATLDAANLITLSATITDSDGDTANATANIAGAITFLDDGPMLSNVELGSSVSVDETGGLSSATSAASILSFVADYGEDGANGATFAVTITDTNSGLATADGDHPITLVQTSATLITGVFNDGSGNQTAFTVQINADGTITLTQMVALEHLIDGDNSLGEHNDTLNLAGKISASVTITDGDGDTDTASVAVGAALTFFDDGPSVTLSGVNDSLSVSDADFLADTSTNFADNFIFDGGVDTAASTSFALSASNGSVSGLIDTATGNAVYLFLEGGVVIGREGADALSAASGEEVFRVTVDGSGNVTLDQSRAVDHALSTGSTGSSVTLASDGLIKLIGTVTDKDGDTASKALDIGSNLTFTDDTPTAEPTLTAYLDDDALGGNAGGPDDQSPNTQNLTGTLVDPTEGFGNDGGSVAFNLSSTLPSGFRLVDDPLSDGVLIQQEQGSGNWVTVITVSLNGATGAYTVTQNDNILHVDDGQNDENEVTFTLDAILTDGDGDIANTSLTIVVDDDTPVAVAGTSSGTVDEDGLPGGIAGGTGDVPGEATVATGSVGSLFAAGADAPLAFGFDTAGAQAYLTSLGLTSGGTPLVFVVSGSLITATAGNGGDTVFTMSLASNGSWQFSLVGPLDHAAGDNENNLSIEFGPLVQATDADGDTVTAIGSLSITIDDDTPSAVNDTNALSEDTASVGGNVLIDGTDDSFGADGPGTPAITAISGSGGAGIVGGTTTGTWGTLDLAADGTYTYNMNTSLVQALDDGEFETDTFTYTIIDSDGDTSTATLTLTINGANDAPVANADTNWTIEDAAAPITGNVLQDQSHPGAPSGTFADVADTDVDVEPLTVTTTGTFNGLYGVLTLNADGSYSYDLYTEAQNPASYNTVQALSAGDTPLTDSFNYTSSDGTDSAASTLTISIFGANDAPVVGAATVATSDEGLMGGLLDNVGNPTDTTNLATANGNISITDADDTAFTVTLSIPTESLAVADGSVAGAAITWSLSLDGKTLTGTINGGSQTAITVVIDDLGAFTVTQSLPIFHPITGSEDVVSFTVDVNVNDGTTTTTRTDAITVNIEDDSPVAVVADSASGTNLAGGVITADLDADNNVDNNFGGDGGRVIFTAASIAALEAQALTSDFVALAYSISPDGTVLTAVKQGTSDTVFTLTLDPVSAPNQYVLNLVQEIDSSSTVDFNGGDFNFVGGNLSWTGFVPLNETLGGTAVDNQSRDLLLTPEINGANAGSVNTTATIGGISGGASVGSGETFRIDFVLDLRGNPADTVGGQNYAAAANRDHVFDGHYDANGATALFKSTNGSKVRITAFDDPDGNTAVGDGVIDTITGVTISYLGVSFGSIIIPTITPTNYTVNGQVFTVTLNSDGSVSIDGIRGEPGSSLLGTVVGIFTADGFNSVEYTYESGGNFQIGDFGATVITNEPVSFDVPIFVIDNDGDMTNSGAIDITLNPAPAAASTSGGTQGTQSFSTVSLLADDSLQPINPDNDNGPRPGSGETTLFRFEDALRSTVRTMEFSTVAALSGGLALTQAAVTQVQSFESGQDVDWNGLALSGIDFQAPSGFDFQASALDTLPDLLTTMTGAGNFGPISDLSRFDLGPADSAQLPQFVQALPDQFELYLADSATTPDSPVFPFAAAAGPGLDQAMEALLLLNAADGALQKDIAGIGGNGASAVLADIAAQDTLEQLIGSFDNAGPGSTPAVAAAPVIDGGLLNHVFDGSIHFAGTGSLVVDQIDDAAMAAAQA